MQYGGKIVTSGLILALDAGSTKSYPGTGTTWFDRSENRYNGTLTNGPTFNSSNGGSISFSGASAQKVTFGNILNYTTGNFSFLTWVYFGSFTTTPNNNGPVFLYKGGYNVNGYYAQVNTSGGYVFVIQTAGGPQYLNGNTTLSINKWYQISVTRIGTSFNLYLNGVADGNTSFLAADIVSSSDTFTLGYYNDGYPIYMNGRIASCLNYNRGLSAVEILQNFTATRARFGL